MSWLNQLEVIKDTLQTAVDTTVTRIEEIHIAIANMPLEQLEKNGMTAIEKTKAKERQQELISAIYGTIRSVNAKVGELASDLFEALEDGQFASQVHKEQEAAKTATQAKSEAAPVSDEAAAATVAEPSSSEEVVTSAEVSAPVADSVVEPEVPSANSDAVTPVVESALAAQPEVDAPVAKSTPKATVKKNTRKGA